MKRVPDALFVLFAFSLIAADKTDKEALRGQWRATVIESRGKPTTEDSLQLVNGRTLYGMILTLDDESATEWLGRPFREWKYSINPATTPKQIDFERKGLKKVIRRKGIYKLEAGKLIICWGDQEAEERPSDFRTTAHDGRMKVTFERVGEQK